jgi:hypothetical protein
MIMAVLHIHALQLVPFGTGLSSILNVLGATSFATLLFHENNLIGQYIYSDWFRCQDYLSDQALGLWHSIRSLITTCLLGTAVEVFRGVIVWIVLFVVDLYQTGNQLILKGFRRHSPFLMKARVPYQMLPS